MIAFLLKLKKTGKFRAPYNAIPIALVTIFFLTIILILNLGVPVYKVHKSSDALAENWSQFWSGFVKDLSDFAGSDIVERYIKDDPSLTVKISEKFYSWNNDSPVKAILHIIDTEGNVLYSSVGNISDVRNTLNLSFLRIMHSGKDLYYEQNRIPYSIMKTSFSVALPVKSYNDILGYIVYNLSEAGISELSEVNKDVYYVIVDQNQYVISSNYQPALDSVYRFNPMGIKPSLPGLFLRTTPSTPLGLKIHTFYFPQYSLPALTTILIFATILVVSMVKLASSLSRKVLAQNDRLVTSILTDNNLNEMGSSDEDYVFLPHSYAMMAKRLREAMAANKELIELKKNIEIQQLESRFHPHFILNILETTRYAIMVDQKLAVETILTLSNLLKYSLYTEEDMVPLRIDMQHVEEFLRLYKIRYGERLIYEISLEPGAEEVIIPKLLFQPIVENSLKHGYRYKDKLIIKIHIAREGDALSIHISDDGGEMGSSETNRLREWIWASQAPPKHIGLWNINRRLILLYGQRYGLQIGCENGGFSVKMTIPI